MEKAGGNTIYCVNEFAIIRYWVYIIQVILSGALDLLAI